MEWRGGYYNILYYWYLIFDIKFVVILHTFNPLSAKKPLNPKWKWKNASARLAFRLCRPYHFSISQIPRNVILPKNTAKLKLLIMKTIY